MWEIFEEPRMFDSKLCGKKTKKNCNIFGTHHLSPGQSKVGAGSLQLLLTSLS